MATTLEAEPTNKKAAHAPQDDERLATWHGFDPATFYAEPRLIGAFARSGFDRKWHPVASECQLPDSGGVMRLIFKGGCTALVALCSLVGLPETQRRKIVHPKPTFGGRSECGRRTKR